MDEKSYQDLQKIIDARKLDAAKKDLENWKSGSYTFGHPDQRHKAFKNSNLRSSCALYAIDHEHVICQTKELGKCIFYECDKRPSLQAWLKHHEETHPEEDLNYVSCDTCKILHTAETRFMEDRIAEFERKLNSIAMPNGIPSSIEAMVEADLDSILAEEGLFEGKKGQRFITYYERNPKLRSKAIIIHGFKCMACGFDFEEKYGERGSKFIEVHHLMPVSSLEEESMVDPEKEMVVVCSNCHRMIHRKKDEVLSLEELKEIIQKYD